MLAILKRKKKAISSNPNSGTSPRFSEIVSGGGGAGTLISGGKRTGVTGVQKKLQQKMNKVYQPNNNQKNVGDFKIGQVNTFLYSLYH